MTRVGREKKVIRDAAVAFPTVPRQSSQTRLDRRAMLHINASIQMVCQFKNECLDDRPSLFEFPRQKIDPNHPGFITWRDEISSPKTVNKSTDLRVVHVAYNSKSPDAQPHPFNHRTRSHTHTHTPIPSAKGGTRRSCETTDECGQQQRQNERYK